MFGKKAKRISELEYELKSYQYLQKIAVKLICEADAEIETLKLMLDYYKIGGNEKVNSVLNELNTNKKGSEDK